MKTVYEIEKCGHIRCLRIYTPTSFLFIVALQFINWSIDLQYVDILSIFMLRELTFYQDNTRFITTS